jgi:hypothetical protein
MRTEKGEKIMTNYNGITLPAYGTLTEIHAALIDTLNHGGQQCSINGWGFTVEKEGFRSNQSGRVYSPCLLEDGVAILTGMKKTGFEGNYDGDNPDFFEIITCKKVPHISKRCIECGMQLNQDEIRHGVCDACYGAAVN